jgi:hypothetical protein
MTTGTELLTTWPPAPLSAVLTVRPPRTCVFVPSVENIPWQRMVEHALAAQTRVWGGGANLVVPLGRELVDDEVFWRIVDVFDPDLIGLHTCIWADLEEIDPTGYTAAVQHQEDQLTALGFNDPVTRARHISEFRQTMLWEQTLSDPLKKLINARVAPLRFAGEPETVYLDGSSMPSAPLMDVADFTDLPSIVVDFVGDLEPLERLLLTHAAGRLLPELKRDLTDREIQLEEVAAGDGVWLTKVFSRVSAARRGALPLALPELGLGRRFVFGDVRQVVLVVGGEVTDFFLFHGLSRIRPYVFWLPSEMSGNEVFLYALSSQLRHTAQSSVGGRNRIEVVTLTDPDGADAIVERLGRDHHRQPVDVARVEWQTVVPRSAPWRADPHSERRVSLLRQEGETQELPTPIPVSVSTRDPQNTRWMVDVELDGWTPTRNQLLGPKLLHGLIVDEHASRTSRNGLSYVGSGWLMPSAVGLEGAALRPRVAPLTLIDQVQEAVRGQGWSVTLSDKGAFALQSARLFGGLDALVAALRSRERRPLFDAYVTPTRTNDPGLFLRDTNRRYLTLEDAAGLVGNAEVATVVASLFDNGVLTRGHVLKCDQCRATSFYALREDQTFDCVRCLARQRATRFSWLGAAEPQFRYALHEVVYQFFLNNGQLPLLAAYDQFASDQRRRGAFDAAFELEYRRPNGRQTEHDITATAGAELWIGEATAADNFGAAAGERTRMRALRETARAVDARGVIFVTEAASFSARTKQTIDAVFDDKTWPTITYVEGFSAGVTPESGAV